MVLWKKLWYYSKLQFTIVNYSLLQYFFVREDSPSVQAACLTSAGDQNGSVCWSHSGTLDKVSVNIPRRRSDLETLIQKAKYVLVRLLPWCSSWTMLSARNLYDSGKTIHPFCRRTLSEQTTKFITNAVAPIHQLHYRSEEILLHAIKQCVNDLQDQSWLLI